MPTLGRVRSAIGRSRAYLRLRDLLVRRDAHYVVAREDLARRYLHGSGIEIGALFKPLRLPPGTRARYVDRVTRAELLELEAEVLRSAGIDPAALPDVDVVAEADRLDGIADASEDFVVANHVLEHLEDPIAGLEAMLRVTRPGGAVLITLPDARVTFDAPRARTSPEHLLADHREGPARSRRAHYEEWAIHIEGATGPRVAERVEEFALQDARHHFHVWELPDFLALLRAVDLPARLLHAQVQPGEFAVVLERV